MELEGLGSEYDAQKSHIHSAHEFLQREEAKLASLVERGASVRDRIAKCDEDVSSDNRYMASQRETMA